VRDVELFLRKYNNSADNKLPKKKPWEDWTGEREKQFKLTED
jgi:hypothetical protein